MEALAFRVVTFNMLTSVVSNTANLITMSLAGL